MPQSNLILLDSADGVGRLHTALANRQSMIGLDYSRTNLGLFPGDTIRDFPDLIEALTDLEAKTDQILPPEIRAGDVDLQNAATIAGEKFGIDRVRGDLFIASAANVFNRFHEVKIVADSAARLAQPDSLRQLVYQQDNNSLYMQVVGNSLSPPNWKNLSVDTRIENAVTHGFSVGDILYMDAAGDPQLADATGVGEKLPVTAVFDVPDASHVELIPQGGVWYEDTRAWDVGAGADPNSRYAQVSDTPNTLQHDSGSVSFIARYFWRDLGGGNSRWVMLWGRAGSSSVVPGGGSEGFGPRTVFSTAYTQGAGERNLFSTSPAGPITLTLLPIGDLTGLGEIRIVNDNLTNSDTLTIQVDDQFTEVIRWNNQQVVSFNLDPGNAVKLEASEEANHLVVTG